jgi:hypothetical protein
MEAGWSILIRSTVGFHSEWIWLSAGLADPNRLFDNNMYFCDIGWISAAVF